MSSSREDLSSKGDKKKKEKKKKETSQRKDEGMIDLSTSEEEDKIGFDPELEYDERSSSDDDIADDFFLVPHKSTAPKPSESEDELESGFVNLESPAKTEDLSKKSDSKRKSKAKVLDPDDFEALDVNTSVEVKSEDSSEKKEIKKEQTHFYPSQRLLPTEVYLASVGIFESNKNQFELDHVVEGDLKKDIYAPQEYARVYRRKADGMLFVLYAPGKDNDDEDPSRKVWVKPLSHIIAETNANLAKYYKKNELRDAKKIFIVAESNRYWGSPVRHYIKADLTKGILTTDDSMDRPFGVYDESNIEKSIKHTKMRKIKRGWQDMFRDDWSCGHNVIDRIRTDAFGLDAPKSFVVDTALIDSHFEYYKKGRDSVKTKKAAWSVSLPVYGTGAFASWNTGFPTSALESMFVQQALDPRLEVILKNVDKHNFTLRIYTDKSIKTLEDLGITKSNDNENKLSYELIIPVKIAGDPEVKSALNMFIHKDGKVIPVNVTHAVPASQLQLFSVERKVLKPYESTQSKNKLLLLQAISDMNQYLAGRVKASVEQLGKLGSDDAVEYLMRLKNWYHVLKDFNLLIKGELKKDDVPITIEKFKTSLHLVADDFIKKYRSKNYARLLHALADAISIPLPPTLSQQLEIYMDMYKQLNTIRFQMVRLDRQPRFFDRNPQQTLNAEMEIYRIMYDKLPRGDAANFPRPQAVKRVDAPAPPEKKPGEQLRK